MMYYRKISDTLKETYGCKVYKIPLHVAGSCPNREKEGACTICGEGGIDFELLEAALPLEEQIWRNKESIRAKYKAEKFILYFQNYTSTWMEEEELFNLLQQCLAEDVVEIALSTRPDTLPESLLEKLETFQKQHGVKLVLEMGVQTVQYRLLREIRRGHGLAEILDALMRARAHELSVCAHVILNLPGSTMEDAIETAKVLNLMKVSRVKLHSLYVPKGSAIAKDYEAGILSLLSADVYEERVIEFLRHLNPEISLERLFARAPEKDTLFCNWGRSWRFLQNEVERRMEEGGYYQGECYEQTRTL